MCRIEENDLHLLSSKAACLAELVLVKVYTIKEITWKCVQLLDEASQQNVMHFKILNYEVFYINHYCFLLLGTAYYVYIFFEMLSQCRDATSITLLQRDTGLQQKHLTQIALFVLSFRRALSTIYYYKLPHFLCAPSKLKQ